MEQVIARLPAGECHFWATQSGAELDLLATIGGRPVGFEFKVSEAPSLTRSMTIARSDLGLDRLLVVAPVARGYPLAERIDVVPLAEAVAFARHGATG